jgi:hypothetical protein
MKHKITDPRYRIIKILIETGDITKFSDIFLLIPRSVVSKELGVNYNAFKKHIKYPHRFTLAQLVVISKLIGIDPMIIVKMAYLSSPTIIKVV